MSVRLLPSDQQQLVEAIALRVVELLEERQRQPSGLVDAGTLADLLAISRSMVYEHADELGAVQLGDGPRARLRFDPETALEAWTRRDDGKVSHKPKPAASQAIRRRRRRAAARDGETLLPVSAVSHLDG